MKISTRTSRTFALASALALSTPFLFAAAPAQAKDGKNAKIAATALGVFGAYSLLKGKTTQGAVALGAGYLAYRKGRSDQKKAQNRYPYSSRSSRPIYPNF